MTSTNAVAGPSRVPEGSSMSSVLLTPLNELHSLSQALFLSLSPAQNKPPPPPPLSAFLACDEALSAAVNLTYKHQIKQRRIEALKAEILELDTRWREICTELQNEKVELESLIEEGDKRIEGIEQAKKGIFFPTYSFCMPYMPFQHLFHTPNYSPMLKVLARSRLLLQICQILLFLVNLLHHSSFHLSLMKKRCGVVVSMPKRLWAY